MSSLYLIVRVVENAFACSFVGFDHANPLFELNWKTAELNWSGETNWKAFAGIAAVLAAVHLTLLCLVCLKPSVKKALKTQDWDAERRRSTDVDDSDNSDWSELALFLGDLQIREASSQQVLGLVKEGSTVRDLATEMRRRPGALKSTGLKRWEIHTA